MSARYQSVANRHSRRRGTILATVLLLGIAHGFADQPVRFNYQARLTDAAGSPLQGAHTLYLGVWDNGTSGVADSGVLVYSETAAVTLRDGVASHAVGTGTPTSGALTEAVFQTPYDLHLQVAVDTAGNVVLPRTRLEPVPLAVRAATADTAGSAANGLPAGFLALGSSAASPPGFTFTGRILPMNWQARAPMASARTELGAAAFNGRIYAIAGYGGAISSANEEFDPQTDRWATKTALPTPRFGLTCTVLSGLIYAVGGQAGPSKWWRTTTPTTRLATRGARSSS